MRSAGAWALVLCAAVLVGCGEDKKSGGAGAPSAGPSAPEAEVVLPPPPPGMTRIESLDIDVVLPAGVKLTGGRIEGPDCTMSIIADPSGDDFAAEVARYEEQVAKEDNYYRKGKFLEKEEREGGWRITIEQPRNPSGSLERTVVVRRKVGEMRIDCRASVFDKPPPACVEAVCASMKGVPGGATATPYPLTEPVISVGSWSGQGGREGGTSVYQDGTIHNTGPKCLKWRSGITKVDPAKVAALLAELAKSPSLPPPAPPDSAEGKMGHREPSCPDGGSTGIHIRLGAEERSASYSACTRDSKSADEIRSAISKVRALGGSSCK